MNAREIPLLKIHSALSHLLFAVRQEMPPGCAVELRYCDDLYLSVEVETSISMRQTVVDRLSRGVLNGDYDYRFKLVSHQPTSTEPRQYVTALVDLCHEDGHVKRAKVTA